MTKKQRNEAYRFAYEQIAASNDTCICWELEEYKPGLRPGWFFTMVQEHYPELWLFRPEDYHGYWFRRDSEGQNERLTCLAFCIAMTEND